MKAISFNVNGLRAILEKGFLGYVEQEAPDILCLQETKLQAHQIPQMELPYGYRFWNHAKKPGYSGTAVFCKEAPVSVTYDFPATFEQTEGRVITVRFPAFTLVNVYTPNSKAELERLDYRSQLWDPQFLAYVTHLQKDHPVVICGDLNVAHQPIDLARPDENTRSAGFTQEERSGFERLLHAGFIDTFRSLYPSQRDSYSWWSYRAGARKRNVGWRIDYFLSTLPPKDAFIRPEVLGSDHAPVGMVLGVH